VLAISIPHQTKTCDPPRRGKGVFDRQPNWLDQGTNWRSPGFFADALQAPRASNLTMK
jgi:hypothetical protein